MPEDTKSPPKKSKGRKRWLLLLLLLLLLFLLIMGVLFFLRSPSMGVLRSTLEGFLGKKGADSTRAAAGDSLALIDSSHAGESFDSLKDTTSAGAVRPDTAARRQAVARPPKALAGAADSTGSAKDTVPPDPCALDTVPPWIFPDPSGGLHRRHVAVRLLSVEYCTIEWRFGGQRAWQAYTDEPILITHDTTLEFRARDSCGNVLPPRTEIYTIAKPMAYKRCPDEMEFVKIAENEFCIDRYEWPNKRGAKPFSYVSIYQARDSCFTAQKRLCSTDEWVMACGGAYGWNFPYGGMYEPRACNTQDTCVSASGKYVECRGYFDVYDMSGNLAEWTNTPSARNRQFYNVMGGFWESGPQANCYEKRYSYFPQNRHNPVGFRCCRDAESAKETGQK